MAILSVPVFVSLFDGACPAYDCLQTAKLMQRYANKRLQEEKEMRDLVQQVADGHKNSKAAKVKLQEFKQRIGD